MGGMRLTIKANGKTPYCIVCGQNVVKDPEKCCHHIAWSNLWP